MSLNFPRNILVCIAHMLLQKDRSGLTKRALDAGDSAAFSSIFLASGFSAPKQNPRPPQRQ